MVNDMADLADAVSVSVTSSASVKLGRYLGSVSPLTESEEESVQRIYAKANEEQETAVAELSD